MHAVTDVSQYPFYTANCYRYSCGPLELKLERFSEAIEDASTGLTYAALTRQNKQSVWDAERLFSKGVMDFMKKKNDDFEEKFIRVVLNWR